MSTRWVVQLNLGKDDDARRIQAECTRLGQPCEMLRVIPFSETLPHVPTDMPTIFYGGTNWIHAIQRSGLWTPGAWFDEERFRISTVLDRYGKHALNHDGRLTTFGAFVADQDELGTKPEELFFIRPDRDAKEFAGDVIKYGDFEGWYQRISHGGYTITPNTRILVADPVGIATEWRCFMVAGKVSSASQYRTYGNLDVSPQVPLEVIEFAETMANLWSPSDVFVMDVGRSGSDLYVIENNCFNSAGFYATDLEKVVRDVSTVAQKG